MSVITDLFNGDGYIYQVKPSGAIDTFPNDYTTANKILVEAVKSRIIYEAQAVDTFDFTDPNYGSRFYLNDDVAAPVHDITGALEVTDYLILDTRNDLMQGDIVAGDVEVTRKSRVTVIPMVPEVGTSDELISLSGDLLVGDLIIILPKGGGPTYVITIKDKEAVGVVDGNFKLHNDQDIVLNGTNDVCLFIKNSDSIKEISRPDSQLLSIAKKTLTAGGGNYYTLDPSGGAETVTTKRGLVILEGGATLAAPWTVGGENGGDTSISQGTTMDIILDSPLITSTPDGNTLTIFGIDIPDVYCKNYNFMVRAWYNEVDNQWEARMFVDQLKETWTSLVAAVGSGEEGPVFTANAAVIDPASEAYAIKTIAHNENVYNRVDFMGTLISAVTMTSADGNAIVGNAGELEWLPYEPLGSYSQICPFVDPVDALAVTSLCIISIVNGILYLRVVDGFTLSIGDAINVSNITYLAGEQR